jgi:hypothetical protein
VQPQHIELLRDCVRVEHGVLPDAGGWTDQAALFTQAWPLVTRELQHWRQVAAEQAQREARDKAKRR